MLLGFWALDGARRRHTLSRRLRLVPPLSEPGAPGDTEAVPPAARDTPSGPFAVTIVVDLPITKLDALDVIAFVADSEVEHAGTAYPRVGLEPGVWAEVQIPRFADPPPLAVEVCSDVSETRARRAAERLVRALEAVGWTIRDA